MTDHTQQPIVTMEPGWTDVLVSPGPSAEIGEAAALYAGLIGRWQVDVIDYGDDGSQRSSEGEWHFGWVLEGRAIQDLFVVPARALRRADLPRPGNRYGTTIRFYDRGQGAWRIVWINPVSGALNQLIARKEGDSIVQEGRDDDGTLLRWSFLTVEPVRFHWRGEASVDGGGHWRTQAEFFGRRRAAVTARSPSTSV